MLEDYRLCGSLEVTGMLSCSQSHSKGPFQLPKSYLLHHAPFGTHHYTTLTPQSAWSRDDAAVQGGPLPFFRFLSLLRSATRLLGTGLRQERRSVWSCVKLPKTYDFRFSCC